MDGFLDAFLEHWGYAWCVVGMVFQQVILVVVRDSEQV